MKENFRIITNNKQYCTPMRIKANVKIHMLIKRARIIR